MPDTVFDIKKVKKTSAAYAQKISTLWPLMRRRTLKDENVINDTNRLMRLWRHRIVKLKENGWESVQGPGQAQFMRNCPPAGVIAPTTKICRTCRLKHFCPWCCMRHAEEVYNRFADNLPARGALTIGLNLLEVSNRMVMSPVDAGKYLDGHFVNWISVPKKLLKRIKPLGAYSRVSLEPKCTKKKKTVWCFTYHILALMPTGWQTPTWLANGKRTIRSTVVRSKKALINAVTRTCRYSTGLMYGDYKMTIISLNVHKHRRCCEFTGCLRQTTKAKCDNSDITDKQNSLEKAE